MDNFDGYTKHKYEPYKQPQPSRREWVGLTETEFNEVTHNLEDLEDCWIAIEAKLKEKNNG